MSREGSIAVLCGAGGMVLLLAGLFVPAHYRAIDAEVLRVAGEGTATRAALGVGFVEDGGPSVAALIFRAVREAGDRSGKEAAERGMARIGESLSGGGGVERWGATNGWLDGCCQRLVRGLSPSERGEFQVGPPVLQWLLPGEARAALLRRMEGSTEPAVMALLGVRRLTDTVILPPVRSASGQPMDAGLLMAAAMVDQQRGKAGLGLELERGAMAATQGRGSAPLEAVLLDLLAAARVLDWEQLAMLLDRCEDGASLNRLVAFAAGEERRWASLFALVVASGGARGIGEYLGRHGEGGLKDLNRAMDIGAGAVVRLLKEGTRIHDGRMRDWMVSGLGLGAASRSVVLATQRAPTMALVVRYLLWLDGFFLLLLSGWWGRRIFLAEANRRFQPRPDLISVGVVAVTAAVAVFLASEKYLGLQSGAAAGRAATGLPVLKARVRLELPPATKSPMNEKVIGMLVLFFVLQLAIYLIGLSRLRHIRGQGVDGGVKLKLLDNEESMFDAPLYLGIAGSVLALVLRLTNFGDVSLMASYSSTLFGILFCFIMKVMHVRPYRQQLILESSENVDS